MKMPQQTVDRLNGISIFSNSGTSDGATKGWQTRKGASGTNEEEWIHSIVSKKLPFPVGTINLNLPTNQLVGDKDQIVDPLDTGGASENYITKDGGDKFLVHAAKGTAVPGDKLGIGTVLSVHPHTDEGLRQVAKHLGTDKVTIYKYE